MQTNRLEERGLRSFRQVVRRAYLLASAQLAALLVAACNLQGISGDEGVLLVLADMAGGFGLGFFQLWGAGRLATMAGERRLGDAADWLWYFRCVSWVLAGLAGFGALTSAVLEEAAWGSGWRAGLIGVKLLLGMFWVAQALDAHRARLASVSVAALRTTTGAARAGASRGPRPCRAPASWPPFRPPCSRCGTSCP
jgi:hypothetical protein